MNWAGSQNGMAGYLSRYFTKSHLESLSKATLRKLSVLDCLRNVPIIVQKQVKNHTNYSDENDEQYKISKIPEVK